MSTIKIVLEVLMSPFALVAAFLDGFRVPGRIDKALRDANKLNRR